MSTERLTARIRLIRTVRSDLPFYGVGDTHTANPGEYVAEFNQNGAASVRLSDGSLLGIKPAEFAWLERPPCGPAQAVWDAAIASVKP